MARRRLKLLCAGVVLVAGVAAACGARTPLFVFDEPAPRIDAAPPRDVAPPPPPPEASPPVDAPMPPVCSVTRTNDVGIWCCDFTCDLGQSCCPATECPGGRCGKLALAFNCDDQHDCVQSGVPDEACCGRLLGGQPVAYCVPPEDCKGFGLILCFPGDPDPCIEEADSGSPGQCLPAPAPYLGYYACQ